MCEGKKQKKICALIETKAAFESGLSMVVKEKKEPGGKGELGSTMATVHAFIIA